MPATFLKIAAILVLLPLLMGCRAKPKIAKAPVPAAPDPRIEEYIKQGDAHFLDFHLYGWRKAETFYKKALELEKSEAIKKKLLLAQFLIMTREIDEDIVCTHLQGTVDSLCAGPRTPQEQELCGLARQYQEGFGATYGQKRAAQSKRLDRTAFDFENSVVDAYLYSLCLRTYGIEDPKDPGVSIAERYKTSPLFLYLNATKKDIRQISEYERQYPEFAELFALAAEDLFQATKYNAARAYFKKAIELLPDYTRAINGLGNLYLFALEDHERALEYYESALKQDPENTAALFGKGAVLHHIDKYPESNAALDRMLESDISRRGRASSASIRYYNAEANYYKAYNCYLMGELNRARQFVDTSKSHMPDLESTNYLSGLLFFGEKNLESARKDFLTAVQRGGTNCNAHYYLGLIDHERGEREAFNWFLRACSCIEGSVRGIEKQIQSVSGLDLEEIEKATLKVKLEKKLLSFRHSSAAQIDTMIGIVSGAETEKGKYYLDLLNIVLSRLRLPINKN